jgi:hypothetical protein
VLEMDRILASYPLRLKAEQIRVVPAAEMFQK